MKLVAGFLLIVFIAAIHGEAQDAEHGDSDSGSDEECNDALVAAQAICGNLKHEKACTNCLIDKCDNITVCKEITSCINNSNCKRKKN